MSSSTIPAPFVSSEIPHWPGLPANEIHGVLGAVFGNYAVATPNARIMVIPIVGGERSLILRKDFRFGTDDPICHPQLYHRGNRNLACMMAPSVEMDVNHCFRPWQDSWWTECPGLGGIGRMDPDMRRTLSQQSKAYYDKAIKQHCEDIRMGRYPHIKRVDEFDTQKLKDDIFLLKKYWAFCGKPGTLQDVKLRFVNAQRQELNIRSRVDDQLIYAPLLTPTNSTPRLCDHRRMGAVTTNFGIACMLHTAGLPVWYVYQAKYVDRTKFRRFMSDDEVERINGCIEIPPFVNQMGECRRVPYLDWLTGGQDFITRTAVDNAVVLYKGPPHLPERYSAMSSLLGRFTCGWKEEPIQPGFGSPSHHVEHDFSLPESEPPAMPDQPEYDFDFSYAASASPPRNVEVEDHAPPPPMSSSSLPPPAEPVPSSSSLSLLGNSASSSNLKRRLPDSNTSLSAPHCSTKKPRIGKNKSNSGTTIRTNQPAARSRWDTVDAPFMPTPVSGWYRMMQALGKKTNLNPRDTPTFRGVKVVHSWSVLPDAAMLANIKNPETRARYLLTFCRLLPLLEFNVEMLDDPSVSPEKFFIHQKKWRVMLGLGKDGKDNSHAATVRAQIEDQLAALLVEADNAPRVDLRKINAQPARWMGEELAPANSSEMPHPSTSTTREILKFICEVNFRVELLTLDYFLFDFSAPGTTPPTPVERRQEVFQLISYFSASALPEWINDGDGFASDDMRERFDALCGLSTVMEQWTLHPLCCLRPGSLVLVQRAQCQALLEKDQLNDGKVNSFEELVAEHYISSYALIFARPPTVPHHSRGSEP
ncbi:hypothetical protein CYLTODRAFT_424990 [Cylindrobasidium torrendii FP15055 ss-10]|uniref:Uncharacterized protein n=1 Tax=Cylindrobasidium torrendii FP15055 ss-10 TaxID=1314674 RepID=A0A0D7B556_9AGAR|nr:hypothetical protein CYLTODRAFT_424990 [Cylindrobasidium torrendii FP15055 ss-10]